MEAVYEVGARSRIVLAVSCAMGLGIVHHYLFFEQALGLSYPLFTLLFYGFFFFTVSNHDVRLGDFRWLVFAAIIALAMTFTLFSSLIFNILNFLIIPILILFHTTTYAGNRSSRWFEPRTLLHMLDHLFEK